jgi:hypothetical protein
MENGMPEISEEVKMSLKGAEAALSRLFIKLRGKQVHRTLALRNDDLRILAEELPMLVVDVAKGDAGIWGCYERFCLESYGSRLPLIHDIAPGLTPSFEQRVRHFLWMKRLGFKLEPYLSPDEPEFLELSREAAVELSAFPALFSPDTPSLPVELVLAQCDYPMVKSFMDVVLKQSFMFADENVKQFERFDRKSPLKGGAFYNFTDAFLYRCGTPWGGFTPLRAAADLLRLDGLRREELLSWAKSCPSIYTATQADGSRMEFENLFTEERVVVENAPVGGRSFHLGQIVYGRLVPWEGIMHWSGAQRDLSGYDDDEFNIFAASLLFGDPPLFNEAHPSCDEARLAKAFHAIFVKRHGSSVVLTESRQERELLLQETFKEAVKSLPADPAGFGGSLEDYAMESAKLCSEGSPFTEGWAFVACGPSEMPSVFDDDELLRIVSIAASPAEEEAKLLRAEPSFHEDSATFLAEIFERWAPEAFHSAFRVPKVCRANAIKFLCAALSPMTEPPAT